MYPERQIGAVPQDIALKPDIPAPAAAASPVAHPVDQTGTHLISHPFTDTDTVRVATHQ